MLRTHCIILMLAGLAATGITTLYATLGSLKPVHAWNRFDLISEASIVLMASVWLMVLLTARPAGRTRAALAAGLAGLTLGAWAGCLDELFYVARSQAWPELLKSAMTLGAMLSLAGGLLLWRRERPIGTGFLPTRERLSRARCTVDTLTNVGDADYLREQLRLEYSSGAGNCSLAMLDIDDFHAVNRVHGQREGDRLLQAVTHVLLLNLRSTDLLCRYAGDRFALLLPCTNADQARALAEQLVRAVASLRHYPQHGGIPVKITMRHVARPVAAEPRQLLKELNRALERRMPLGMAGDSAARHA